jgi:hypothetical protein
MLSFTAAALGERPWGSTDVVVGAMTDDVIKVVGGMTVDVVRSKADKREDAMVVNAGVARSALASDESIQLRTVFKC